MRIQLIFISIIFSLIISFSIYINRKNEALNNAIISLKQTEMMIETNRNNLRLYYELQRIFSDCKIDENSFTINKINFEWNNIDMLSLILRLNQLYEDRNNFYLISYLRISQITQQKSNNFNISGSLIIPCK